MTIKRVFKNTMVGSQMLLKNGKAIQFTLGRYETSDEAEIAELQHEVDIGTPHIYVDPEDSTVDTTLQDEIKEAQKNAALAVLKKHQAAKEGVVEDPNLVKNADGTLHKPGASEAQSVQVDRGDVPVGPIGAAKEVPVSNTQTVIAKPANVNVAHLLASKTANTGVASTANVGDATAGSAS